jgi:murein DD-endopeptidase MepM/ murein hydrolase activator NlpD
MTLKNITGIFLVAVAVLLTGTVFAKNIYKYQDENGIWHFTDRAPDEGQKFEAIYMEREPEPRIRMRREGPESSPVYKLFNDFWGPVEVELKLSEARNVLTEPPLPARFVIPGQTEQSLIGLGAVDTLQGFSYRLHLSSVPGPPNPVVASDLTIHPPFPADEAYYVSQGFNGVKTHMTEDSRNAIDIVMPVGTTIMAVRDGVVMDVEEDFNKAGTDIEEFADKANHVRILHKDGTMTLYAHLDLASVNVRPGAKVRAGQRIARSGNTGYSSGPHLHFVVQQNVGMKMRSVPFRFHRLEGEPRTPVEKELLSGTLPGRY